MLRVGIMAAIFFQSLLYSSKPFSKRACSSSVQRPAHFTNEQQIGTSAIHSILKCRTERLYTPYKGR